MAIHIDSSSSDKDYYLEKTDPTPWATDSGSSIFPLTMSCWIHPDSLSDHDGAISLGYSATTYPVVSINLRGTGKATAEVKTRTTTALSISAADYTAGAWQHFAGVFASATSRICYLAGVAATENTTSAEIAPSGVNHLTLGEYASTWSRPFDGHLAECAVWNVALSASEIATLVDGYTPLHVRPESLISYFPLVKNTIDVMGANTVSFATDSGGSTTEVDYSDHPRIIEDAPMISRSAWGGI